MSVDLFDKKEIQEKNVLIDTTVQEKNITYPTDVKLQKKIIEYCRKIAREENIQLRQVYRRELNQLMIDQQFHSHPKREKKALAAQRRIKTIAKGKEAKKYEFGNKSSLIKTMKSGIIIGVMAFEENIYDGDTLAPPSWKK